EHAAAARVDVARGGPDLRVGISVEILPDEIDQPPFALEQREHLHRPVDRGVFRVRTRFNGRRRRGRFFLGAGILKGLRQTTLKENREERKERELDAWPHADNRCHSMLQSSIVAWRGIWGTSIERTEGLRQRYRKALADSSSYVPLKSTTRPLPSNCQTRVPTSSSRSWSCVTSRIVPSYFCSAMFSALMVSRSRWFVGSSSTRMFG